METDPEEIVHAGTETDVEGLVPAASDATAVLAAPEPLVFVFDRVAVAAMLFAALSVSFRAATLGNLMVFRVHVDTLVGKFSVFVFRVGETTTWRAGLFLRFFVPCKLGCRLSRTLAPGQT